MRQYPIIIYPENTLTIIQFKNVTNTNEIKEGLTNNIWDWSVANCKPIINHQQILLAVTKSISSFNESKKPLSFNINKDIINRLSPSGNFSESLINFGIKSEDKEFYVFLINSDQEKINQVCSVVKGDQIDISNDSKNIYFDHEFAKKVYKITDTELDQNSDKYLENLNRLIINNMAIKGLL